MTPSFSKINFSPIKASLADRVRAHVKNVGPQIGDSIGDFEDQVWTLVEENVAFNWSIKGYLIFFRLGDLVCLLVWSTILTCMIALNDHLIACSL